MEKVLKADEHFERTLNEVLPKSNLHVSKSRLLEKYKLKEEDVNLAINLMACIMFFDWLIFGGVKTFLGFKSRGNKFKLPVCHLVFINKKTKEKKAEGYQISVGGISDILERQKGDLITYTKRGKIARLNKDAQKRKRYSLEETLIGIACHEVRHRLQYFHRIRLLRKKNIGACKSKRLVRIIKFENAVLNEERKIWREEKKPEWYIKKRTTLHELDAKVIEKMAKSAVHYGCNLKKIRKILLTQM